MNRALWRCARQRKLINDNSLHLSRFYATNKSKRQPAVKPSPVQPQHDTPTNEQVHNPINEGSRPAFDWRAPAPLTFRLLAIGSVAFAVVWNLRPFDKSKDSASTSSTTETKPELGPRTFVRCRVDSIIPSSTNVGGGGKAADHMVLRLGLPMHSLPKDTDMPNGVYHVYVKDEDMQVERPYTPINGIGFDGRMTFWIKRYPKGEVSNWIARQAGKSVEIRGPIQQWDWRKEEYDEIVMIGGGTGVTAFAQILHQAFFSSRPVTTSVNAQTHFTLLHCHRAPSQLPPKEIADDLIQYKETDGHRFMERVYVDDLDNEVDDPPQSVTHGFIDRKELQAVLLQRGILKKERSGLWSSERVVMNPEKKVKVLVCGPEGLITSMTGPRPKPNATPTVGGVLGELGFEPSQIIRL